MGNSMDKLATSLRTKFRREDVKKYYKMHEKIGRGSFATVRRATRKSDGCEFAIKCISKRKLTHDELKNLTREVEIMEKVEHQNIVEFVELFDCKDNVYVVLEYLQGGELFDAIVEKGYFSERETANIISDITLAIQYLHKKGIAHRDIKPENLIFSDNGPERRIKLTDFGLSKILKYDNSIMCTRCGTPGYVAPEVLRGRPYSVAVDLWSIGVVLYILLCGYPPFYHSNQKKLFEQIQKAKFSFPSAPWDGISDEAKDLIEHLLVLDPKKRYNCEQILAHPYIQRYFGSSPSSSSLKPRRTSDAAAKLQRGVRMVMLINRMASPPSNHKKVDEITVIV